MSDQLGFVDGFGVVEVIGSAPDGHLVVRIRGTTNQRVIAAAQLQSLDCAAAKTARLHQLRSVRFRQNKTNEMNRRENDARRR